MIPFTLRRPTEVADALALASGSDAVRWLAGGTTLVDLLKLHVEAPAVVIDINRLPLSEVAADGSGVRIGALARMADVARHPLVLQRAPLVAETLLAGDDISDLLLTAGGEHWFHQRRVRGESHGTGCSLSAAIAAGMARGRSLEDAVETAIGFVHDALRAGYRPGRGRLRNTARASASRGRTSSRRRARC